MRTTFASLIALSLLGGAALAGGSPYAGLGDTAPRSVFQDMRDSAPRTPFDQIQDTAPRTVFDDIRDTSPRSDGAVGERELTTP